MLRWRAAIGRSRVKAIAYRDERDPGVVESADHGGQVAARASEAIQLCDYDDVYHSLIAQRQQSLGVSFARHPVAVSIECLATARVADMELGSAGCSGRRDPVRRLVNERPAP